MMRRGPPRGRLGCCGVVCLICYGGQLIAVGHGRRRCPPTQRQEHGFSTKIARATRVIMEAAPFGSRPRPTLPQTASEGVAGRKEHGRGGAETTGVPGLRRWRPVVSGDGVGDLARHGRLL